MDGDYRVVAGIRNAAGEGGKADLYGARAVEFDFTDRESVRVALADCDALFLLRPPRLADVKTYFRPVIDLAREGAVKHIVFLSVQGADRNPVIPHHKIETLIKGSGLPYTFLRPAYFMQNFTTTLKQDIVERNEIYLPAGEARFAMVDVRDVGRVAAHILTAPENYRNQAFDLTSESLLTFGEMAAILREGLNRPIHYTSPNLLSFYLRKRREGASTSFILVLIMLHFLPRLQRPPQLTDWVHNITGREPHNFADFVKAYQTELESGQ